MKYALIVFLLMLTGCAAPEQWARANTSGEEYDKDAAHCNAQMWSIPNGTALQMAMFAHQCMKSKGYVKVPIQNQQKTNQLAQEKIAEPTEAEIQRFELLRVSADKGDVAAQAHLAYSYLTGTGTNKSNALAYKWYLRVAEKVDVNKKMAQNAQANLGFMWLNGLGVKRDNVKAMMWFLLASTSNDKEATKRKNELEPIMLQSEMKEARRLAAVCIAKKYKGCEESVELKWKTCEVTSTYSASKDIVKLLESWKLTTIFGKNFDNTDARLAIFLTDSLSESIIVDLDLTDNASNKDRAKHTTFNAKTGYAKVEVNEDTGNIFIKIGKDADSSFDLQTKCK